MRRVLILSFVFFISLAAFAGTKEYKRKPRGWSPVRLCFTEDAIAFPENADIYGINLGIPASYNSKKIQKIYGLDIGIVSIESKATGVQLGLTNWSNGSRGVQIACANIVKEVTGLQIGIANVAKKSCVFQIGALNFSRRNSTGIQIGVFNFMDKGFLPFFPLINFSL